MSGYCRGWKKCVVGGSLVRDVIVFDDWWLCVGRWWDYSGWSMVGWSDVDGWINFIVKRWRWKCLCWDSGIGW